MHKISLTADKDLPFGAFISSYMGGIFTLMFLTMIAFMSGLIVIAAANDERSRRLGFRMVILGIILLIATVLVYGAGNYDL